MTALATVTEIDIYRLISQSVGQLTVNTSAYNKYPQGGTAATVTWPPAVRSGLLGATPLQLTQTFHARLEPQSY